MRKFQILFRNASGGSQLSRVITAQNPEEAKKLCAEFVLKNFIAIYEVPQNDI
jgi:hypothetical protein